MIVLRKLMQKVAQVKSKEWLNFSSNPSQARNEDTWVNCPFNGCSALLVIDGAEIVTSAECPSCHRLLCAHCEVPWHAGITCHDFQTKLKPNPKCCSKEKRKNSPFQDRHDDEKKKKKVTIDQSSTCFCGLCFSFKTDSDVWRSECNHFFCTECISKHVASLLNKNTVGVNCPLSYCGQELKPQELQSILPKELIVQWESAWYEYSTLGWQKTYCPFKNCPVLLVLDDDEAEIVSSAECPCCHRLFCANCKVPWHAGINCEEFQENMKTRKSPIEEKKKKIVAIGTDDSENSKSFLDTRSLNCFCGVCFDFKSDSDIFRGSDCNHSFCVDCISMHVAAQLSKNVMKVNCPDRNCCVELKPELLQHILPEEVIVRWKFESSIA